MTDLSNERTLGGPFEGSNYGDPVSDAMYDSFWLWGEDDPHPSIEVLRKANTFTPASNDIFRESKISVPGRASFSIDAAPVHNTSQFGSSLFNSSTPSASISEKGLMSNFSDYNRTLENQVGSSISEGKNADGHRLTEKYNQLNPYRDQRQIKTDEGWLNVKKQMEPVLFPKRDNTPVQQGISSIASKNYNDGLEYLQPMQGYLKKGHTEGFQHSNETEAAFTHELGRKTGQAIAISYGNHYGDVAASIDGAETGYGKLFPEEQGNYETFAQRIAENGGDIISEHATYFEPGEKDKKHYDEWEQGFDVAKRRKQNLGAKMLYQVNEQLPRKDVLIKDRNAFYQQMVSNYEKNRDIEATFLKSKEIIDWNDPVKTYDNLMTFCYQTVLGKYFFETALTVATLGRASHVNRAFNVLDRITDFRLDSRGNPVADKFEEHNRQLRFGKEESEEHAELNRMADRLDPYSSTAAKFMIKMLPDVKRKEYLKTIKGVRKDR